MNDFITIDFETAVYSPESAISIGLVKYRNYRPIASYYSLIRPPRLYILPHFTEDVHGLTVDDVKDAPDFKYIWDNEIHGFFGAIPLAAHNASFDMRVLRSVLEYYETPLPAITFFCSLNLARRAWPELESHSLSALAEERGIIYDAHNALADAEACGEIISLCALDISAKAGREKPFEIDKVLVRAGVEMGGLQ